MTSGFTTLAKVGTISPNSFSALDTVITTDSMSRYTCTLKSS
nr:MAG TPA: hypothetical protein [Caudoviricetes sp.]DAT81611.1 MAG TPA: hypothetical protein [Caudoviricetes sp.]